MHCWVEIFPIHAQPEDSGDCSQYSKIQASCRQAFPKLFQVGSARIAPAGARFMQVMLYPPTDSLCNTNPKFTASSFWRCNLICTSWFCYHCSTVVSHNWLVWEAYRSPRWTKRGNTHSLQPSQVSCEPRVETANSLPPFLVFPFLQVCEVSSEWLGRIPRAFPPSVQRVSTDRACLLHTASFH